MDTDYEILEKLRGWWQNPAERQRRHLASREAHTVFLTGNVPDTVAWATGEIITTLSSENLEPHRVLDIGCGPGRYLKRLLKAEELKPLALIGLDKSAEALQEAQRNLKGAGRLLQGDALNLPFSDGTFGAAMANRMLNQTGDILRALREFRRVLAPGGRLFSVTADTTQGDSLRYKYEATLAALGFPPHLYRHTTPPDQRFNRENGADWLAKAGYEQLEVREYRRTLVFPNAEAALEHYATGLIFHKSQGFDEPDIPPELWVAQYKEMSLQLSDELTINSYSFLFCARSRQS